MHARQTGCPLILITVWVVQPTHSAGRLKEQFMALVFMIRLCRFSRLTGMAKMG
jgi:hypothetical protein